MEELNSVCMGIELRYIQYLCTVLNHLGAQDSEQLISNVFWYDFHCVTDHSPYSFSPGVNNQALAEGKVSAVHCLSIDAVATTGGNLIHLTTHHSHTMFVFQLSSSWLGMQF